MALAVSFPINLSFYPWRGLVLWSRCTLPYTTSCQVDACLTAEVPLHRRRILTWRGAEPRLGEQAQQSIHIMKGVLMTPLHISFHLGSRSFHRKVEEMNILLT